jgi:hypothetical protein
MGTYPTTWWRCHALPATHGINQRMSQVLKIACRSSHQHGSPALPRHRSCLSAGSRCLHPQPSPCPHQRRQHCAHVWNNAACLRVQNMILREQQLARLMRWMLPWRDKVVVKAASQLPRALAMLAALQTHSKCEVMEEVACLSPFMNVWLQIWFSPQACIYGDTAYQPPRSLFHVTICMLAAFLQLSTRRLAQGIRCGEANICCTNTHALAMDVL